jgi:hypothetical protein
MNMFLSLIGFVFFLLFSLTTYAEVFILKDGRIFEANYFYEKDGHCFINMEYGLVQIKKDLVKKIVGPSITPGEDEETNFDQNNYQSINSVLILRTGQLLKTKKTYTEDDFVVCETAKGTKYYKKDDIEAIVNPKNIIIDKDSFMAQGNKSSDKKTTFLEGKSNVFILTNGIVFEANDYYEKDGQYFINREYGSIQIKKDRVSKIVGSSPIPNTGPKKSTYENAYYQSVNSAVILRNGQLLLTKKTYAKNEHIVCETAKDTKYYKRDDVDGIVYQKNILTNKDDFMTLDNKNLDTKAYHALVKEKSGLRPR